ncbi:MAG: DUF1926 domain-containing protein, partial [Candidatus Lokiarchaeota archaeon]|nr:DUF1926 domain-containing protein [Candidatus Lokiarchaeota archaeon]
YEFGDFVDENFNVTSSEKEGKIAIIEMEKIGSIKDPDSNERHPVRITKDIYAEENEIEIILRINFEEIPENEKILDRIIRYLNIAVDIPFFFNGDPNKFHWESKQVDFKDKENTKLLEPFQYMGSHFKAYDEIYDLNFEIDISSKSDSIKITKFPIIAYAYTDEGYKEIYQGINITPVIKLEKHLEFHLKIQIF